MFCFVSSPKNITAINLINSLIQEEQFQNKIKKEHQMIISNTFVKFYNLELFLFCASNKQQSLNLLTANFVSSIATVVVINMFNTTNIVGFNLIIVYTIYNIICVRVDFNIY